MQLCLIERTASPNSAVKWQAVLCLAVPGSNLKELLDLQQP